MRPVLLGIVPGIAGASGLTRLMESLLFGVQARDPVTRVDPLEALRYQ